MQYNYMVYNYLRIALMYFEYLRIAGLADMNFILKCKFIIVV